MDGQADSTMIVVVGVYIVVTAVIQIIRKSAGDAFSTRGMGVCIVVTAVIQISRKSAGDAFSTRGMGVCIVYNVG